MKLQKIKAGFTLIELLVVITIIGILSTWATTVYTSQIQKARDTTRITDIKALQSWIEQFYQDTYVYPLGWVDWVGESTSSILDYLPNLAEDPKHDQTCIGSRCGYIYTVDDDDNGIEQWSYEVSTSFENKANVTNKANEDSDNGLDDSRYEVGLNTDDNDTTQDQDSAFVWTEITDSDTTTETLVIMKSSVVKK